MFGIIVVARDMDCGGNRFDSVDALARAVPGGRSLTTAPTGENRSRRHLLRGFVDS